MPLEIQQQNSKQGSEAEEMKQGGWSDSWAWLPHQNRKVYWKGWTRRGLMKRGVGGQQVWVSKWGWEISRKIQIGWVWGNGGTEVLAALSRQISHTVFACARLVQVSYSSLERKVLDHLFNHTTRRKALKMPDLAGEQWMFDKSGVVQTTHLFSVSIPKLIVTEPLLICICLNERKSRHFPGIAVLEPRKELL